MSPVPPSAGTHHAYTPEQNGIVERFFHSLKEECVWRHNFESSEEARRAVSNWIYSYDTERPHQALDYRSLAEYRPQQLAQVA